MRVTIKCLGNGGNETILVRISPYFHSSRRIVYDPTPVDLVYFHNLNVRVDKKKKVRFVEMLRLLAMITGTRLSFIIRNPYR